MNKSINNYQEIFNNIPDAILIMEGQYFIDANSSALNLFDMASKKELFLLHPSQLSPQISIRW